MSDVELSKELTALVTSYAFKGTDKKGIVHIAMAIGMNHNIPSQTNIVIGNSIGRLHSAYWGKDDAKELYSRAGKEWVEDYLFGFIQGFQTTLAYTGVIKDDN